MEYKRLTDEKEHYKKCVGCSYRNCKYCEDKYEYAREVHKRLAELEDKIEQGTLIELPCKVGDTVYVVYPVSGIQEWEVGSIGIHANDIAFRLGHKGTEDYNVAWLKEEGEYLFFTREEAEKRLKELQG